MEHGCTFIPCAAPDSDVNGLNMGHYFLHQIARVGYASHHIASIACYIKSRRIVGLGGCTRSCAHVLAQQLTASNRGACSGRTQGDQSDILYTAIGRSIHDLDGESDLPNYMESRTCNISWPTVHATLVIAVGILSTQVHGRGNGSYLTLSQDSHSR